MMPEKADLAICSFLLVCLNSARVWLICLARISALLLVPMSGVGIFLGNKFGGGGINRLFHKKNDANFSCLPVSILKLLVVFPLQLV